jgi:hypothetical protein
LEAIGFVWCLQKQAWNEIYRRLVSYLKEHGDGTVPLEMRGDPQLGSWVSKQRYRRKKGLLNEKRIRKLDEVGMWWRL